MSCRVHECYGGEPAQPDSPWSDEDPWRSRLRTVSSGMSTQSEPDTPKHQSQKISAKQLDDPELAQAHTADAEVASLVDRRCPVLQRPQEPDGECYRALLPSQWAASCRTSAPPKQSRLWRRRRGQLLSGVDEQDPVLFIDLLRLPSRRYRGQSCFERVLTEARRARAGRELTWREMPGQCFRGCFGLVFRLYEDLCNKEDDT